MQTTLAHVSLPLSLTVLCLVPAAAAPEGVVSGELKAWHKVTLTLDGPAARERDTAPNPFLDYRLTVRFTHESGSPAYDVPGYFAADGNAGETSAEAGSEVARAPLARQGGPLDVARRFDGARPARWPSSRPAKGEPVAARRRPRPARSRSPPPTRPAATSAPAGGCSTWAATTSASPAPASRS